MAKRIELGRGTQLLFVAACLVIVIAGMKAAQSLVNLLLLSLFIAILCIPFVHWMKRKGMSTALTLVLVTLSVVLVLLGLSALMGSSINTFSENLPVYETRIKQQTDLLWSWVEAQLGYARGEQDWREAVNPGALMGFVQSLFAGLGSVLSNGIVVLLIVVFILVETVGFEQRLQWALDAEKADSVSKYISRVIAEVNRYMALKALISLLTGVLIAIWLAILGVDFPLLWGLLAFLLNFVPNIGSVIAAVPAVLLALIQLGPGSALLACIGFLVVNFGVGNVLEPRILGEGLDLSTLVVFLSLVIWGWVLGSVGMLLSVPLTMVAKIALDSSENMRWVARLMGTGPPPETEPPPIQVDAPTSA